MVKNTIGGSKTKSFARKTYNKPSQTNVRLPNNIYEKIAIVTKMSGGGRCQIITSDSLSLNCVIRNKFKARFKSMNLISLHSIILVGLREWEAPDNFKICDLLEVYSQDDITHLRNIPSLSIHSFDSFYDTHTTHNTHEFEFSNTIQDYTHHTITEIEHIQDTIIEDTIIDDI
jgi:hypothetical protein